MQYSELKELANKYIGKTVNFPPPINSFNIANNLGLKTKNSIECKKDFANSNTPYPLESSNACLALVNGEYVIYYDERYAYKNFSVAHEIAHYILQHGCDGAIQHHDANLLAAIIVAPIEVVKKSNIKNVKELADIFFMPYDVACEYWAEITDIQSKSRNKTLIAICISVFVVAITSSSLFVHNAFMRHNDDSNDPPNTLETVHVDTCSDTVYITSSGTHYHRNDCIYIKYKTNVVEISYDEVGKRNLEPCEGCIR